MKAGTVAPMPVFTKRLLGAALKEEAFLLIHGIVEAGRAGKVARVQQLEKELSRVKRRLTNLGVRL
jgi:hypothetical protein